MARKVDIAPPTDREREAELRSLARRLTMSRISKPMRPTKPTASDFDTNLDFRNRLADEGLFPTPISGKDTLPRRFNQPGYVPVWTPNPNEKGGYSVHGFPQVVSADDAVMGMAPPSDPLDVHPYLMPFSVNRELLPPPSLNVEDRRSTAQTIQNLLAADPRTQGSSFMPSWLTPSARTMERSPGDTTTQEGTAERHFDPYLLQPDLNQMPARVRQGDPNARQLELPGSVPADVPVPSVSTGRWGDQALQVDGGETLTMGPNEEAVSSTDRRALFVTTYLPYAQEAARLTGVDPAVVLAVAAHETGWGRKAPGNNFFGIKGRGQTFATHEYVNGKRVNVRAGFRSYADPRDSFLDWARLMQKPNYAGVLAATTPEDQIKALKAAGYATDPFYVRKLNNVRQQVSDLGGAIQVLPEAIAGLQDAVGGTLAPNLPVGTEAYAPALLAALDATPAQAAIDAAFGQPGDLTADQIDELTRTDAAGNYTNPLTAPPPAPFVPASGPIGPNLGSMLSPADVLNAGPRPRPAALSPVRPPMPNTMDRNLGVLPPTPRLRPGGAPDAGLVPLPPSRPAPDASMANMPAMVGMPPSAAPGGVGAVPVPAGPSDLVPFLPPPAATAAPAIAPPLERANRIAGGQGGPVIPISPDEMRDSLANAGANTEMSLGLGGLGTPETAMSLDRTFPPLAAAPSPWSDRSRAFDIPPPMTRMAEFGPSPRPNITPDFDFAAGPGPTFTPPSLTPDIRGRPEYPGSMPLAPPPLATAADDPYRAPSSFDASRPLAGGGGSDVLAAGNASPLPLPPSPFRYDPLSSARLNLPPTVPAVPSIDDIPGVTVATDPNNITLPEEPIRITSPVQDADVANKTVTVPPPLPTAANAGVTAPSQAKTPESQKRRSSSSEPSLLARIGNALVPGSPFGPGGGGVGGFGFGIGPNGFFSNAGSFTPFTGAGVGGSSPFNMQPNGQMGTTTWRQGSVTGNPAMSGTMWNRSGDNGSVGYVTDPFTGSMIYSGSPNRF